MGKRLEQTLLQGGHTEGPETYEKMLSITRFHSFVSFEILREMHQASDNCTGVPY